MSSMRHQPTRKHRIKALGQKPYRSYLFIALFASVGLAVLLYARAATPVSNFQAEHAIRSGSAQQISDSSASDGSALIFGTGGTSPTPPPPPPPGARPTKQQVIAGAGPNNPAALRPSGSITVTQDGAVIENVDISNGKISVLANNVTVRNCKVRGSAGLNLIQLGDPGAKKYGFKNLKIEHCRVESLGGDTIGGIGGNGSSNMTVRYTEILGVEADGIKAESGSLYEYNYIHMTKPAGSSAHLDGFQGSGDSNWTARYNFVNIPVESGGNLAFFAQGWNGSVCIHVSNIEFSNNYLYGGNYGIQFAGGKDVEHGGCANERSYISNVRAFGNRFVRDADGKLNGSNIGYRWGYCDTVTKTLPGAVTQFTDNRFEDGSPVPGCGT